MTIAGLREHYTPASLDGIPALWQRLVAFGRLPGRVGSIDYAAVFLQPDGCDYVAGFEVADSAGLPEEFECVKIPARKYAVFFHNEHVARVRNTFDAIMRIWLPASGLRIANTADARAYVLERYGEGFDPRSGMGDIQLWVPVTDVHNGL
jgi:AraC family transcriptional regulator